MTPEDEPREVGEDLGTRPGGIGAREFGVAVGDGLVLQVRQAVPLRLRHVEERERDLSRDAVRDVGDEVDLALSGRIGDGLGREQRTMSSSSAIERGVKRRETSLRSGVCRGGSVWIIGWMPRDSAGLARDSNIASRTRMPAACELKP